MTRLLTALLVLSAGCSETSRNDLGSGVAGIPGSDSYQDEDPPIGSDSFQDDDPPFGRVTGGCRQDDSCSGDGDSAIGAPVGASCDDTHQCVAGAVCGATFEDGEAGPLVCRAECIELDDDAAWCSDDSACCSGVCGPRGLCLEAEGSDGAGSTSGGTG